MAMLLHSSSDPDEDHSKEDEGEVEGFGSEVSLFEYEGAADERDDYRAASDK